MRVIFAGTPIFAIPSLTMLINSENVEILAVLTQADSRSSRGRKLTPSPIKICAEKYGIPTLCPEKLDAKVREEIRALSPELLVVAAYGKIFGPQFLALFPKGGINLHPSILPKHRGPTPISATILAGDVQGGISIQRLALEMDAGDILIQEIFQLNQTENAQQLSEYCAERGAELLLDCIGRIQAGTINPTPQNHDKASYCRLIGASDNIIDWENSADQIDRQVRAYYPNARTSIKGQTLKILTSRPYLEGNSEKSINVTPYLEKPSQSKTLGGEYSHHKCNSSEVPEMELKKQDAEIFQAGWVLGIDKDAGILIQTGKGILAVQELQLQARKALHWKDFLNGNPSFCNSGLGTNFQ